jgi:septum formation protein
MCNYQFNLPAGVELILASASPRRRELLAGMGLAFTVCPCDVDESVPQGMHPADAVVLLARRKAEAVAARYPDAIVLASDTLVEIDALPLGKPQDAADAVATLMKLSGNEHRVHTGVAVMSRGRCLAEKDTTRVFMRPFDEDEARAYVETGEPMDKAGAYGIQGLGGRLVERIEGCYDTVVGLPTRLSDDLLCRLMERDA